MRTPRRYQTLPGRELRRETDNIIYIYIYICICNNHDDNNSNNNDNRNDNDSDHTIYRIILQVIERLRSPVGGATWQSTRSLHGVPGSISVIVITVSLFFLFLLSLLVLLLVFLVLLVLLVLFDSGRLLGGQGQVSRAGRPGAAAAMQSF